MEKIMPLILRILKKIYYPIFIFNSFLSLMETKVSLYQWQRVLSFITKGEK